MLTISMGLMSCSSEEIFTPEDTTNKLLENYTVKRDASGAYSLDYNLADNAEVSLSKDKRSNSNDFYLYSSDNQSKKSFKEALAIQDNSLRVGFTDTETGKKSSIMIIDDKISYSNRNADEDFLNEYSISSNGDGTYDLDFKVADDVTVEFIYNDDLQTYEVHLEDGVNSQSEYLKTFVKEEGVDLKIDFVNHYVGTTSREENVAMVERKPRSIIND
ncbi:hypothetical protein [Asprobacillus argus]